MLSFITGFCAICFLVGLLLGVVIQRGFFCMYSGFSNMVLTKDYRIIRSAVWAALLTMWALNILAHFNYIKLDPKPFFAIGSVLGAVLFSVGMVSSGSCIVGTPMRAASGRIAYWFTLAGMGIGGWLLLAGPLKSYLALIQGRKIMLAGKVPTIDLALGLNRWIIIATLTVLSAWFLYTTRKQHSQASDSGATNNNSLLDKIFKNLWTPVFVGTALAALQVFAFLTKKSPAGLGSFIKGYADVFKMFLVQKVDFGGWAASEVTGILVGVFLAAIISKEFKLVWPKNIAQCVRLFVGGILMGMGAVIAAGGCNLAHLISHVPQLSLGSLLSGTVIVILTSAMVYFIFKPKEA